MGKNNDPNWRVGNTFTEEELNPNRPHKYRETHGGKSPIGNIRAILEEKKLNDPDGYQEMLRRKNEKASRTQSMKAAAKRLLETSIQLSEEERENLLNDFKNKEFVTVQEAIILGQITKAYVEKDTPAAIFLRDTSGQKPKDEVEHSVSIDNILKNAGVLDEEDDLDED